MPRFSVGRRAVGRRGNELQAWRGASKLEVLGHFVERQFGPDEAENSERVEAAYASFRERLEHYYAQEGVRAMPGADAAFAWLRGQGIKVALTTGFYRQVTDIILEGAGWRRGVIDASVSSDEVPQGRPAPFMIFQAMEATGVKDVRRVIKIGDTALDLLAGWNASVRGIVGVLSGSQSEKELQSAQPTHILPSVAALPELVESAFM